MAAGTALRMQSNTRPVKAASMESLSAELRGVGPLALRARNPRPMPRPEFSAQEVRARLSGLASRAFNFNSFQDMVSVFRRAFIAIEERSHGGGNPVLHLRNLLGGGSVPAAKVSPILQRSMAKTLESRKRPTLPSPAEVAYRDAFRVRYGGNPPAYKGWEALKTGLPSALSTKISLAFTVSKGVAYIGRNGSNPRESLECLGNKDRTRESMFMWMDSRRREDGLLPGGLKFPKSPEFRLMTDAAKDELLAKFFVFDDVMTPGTPILIRDSKSLVRASQIHASLSSSALSNHFGKGFAEYWNDINSAASRKQNIQAVRLREDLASFRVAKENIGSGFGGIIERPADSILIVIDDLSIAPRPRLFDGIQDRGPHPVYKSTHALKPGSYPVRTLGCDAGKIQVLDDKSTIRYDLQGREHGFGGPSRLSANGKALGWAHQGDIFHNKNAWVNALHEKGATQEIPEPEPDIEDFSAPQSGFGYTMPDMETLG
jgi:hypothetical protein